LREIWKTCLSIILAFAVLTPLLPGAVGSEASDDQTFISDIAEILLRIVPAPGIEQTGGDWAVIALARSGLQLPEGYVRDYYFKAAEQLEAVGGELSKVKYSEYSRVAIAMTAIGADPRNVGGYDVLAPLLDYDATVYQGINGPAFALIALYASGYKNVLVTDRYIDYILDYQLPDGGFALSGTVSDPDTTAMALTALSTCTSNEGERRADVMTAIDRGVERLSALQRGTGGFTSFSSTNSESVSQAMIALSSIGIHLNDERFVKNGNSLSDNLLTYYIEGQGFEHEIGGGVNLMATEQALCALAAVWRQNTELNGFYDMSDVIAADLGGHGDGLPGKHPDVAVTGIISPEDIFTGINSDDGEQVTRAGFIAALARVLGLKDSGNSPGFADVTPESRFYDEIRAAYFYGIITGRSADVFDPDGAITRQEAAVAVHRASGLCGLGSGVVFDETAIRNILSQFIDYRHIVSWASEALAFCYYFSIYEDQSIEIRPSERILVSEAAGMIYKMLLRARLV